jgi:hypothetical protein
LRHRGRILGGVDVIDAELDGAAEDGHRFIAVARRSEHPWTRKLHRAESDPRHGGRPQDITLRTAASHGEPFPEQVTSGG